MINYALPKHHSTISNAHLFLRNHTRLHGIETVPFILFMLMDQGLHCCIVFLLEFCLEKWENMNCDRKFNQDNSAADGSGQMLLTAYNADL
jgi:hypothetical protein